MIEPLLFDSTSAIFKLYSSLRRIVYLAFDRQEIKITRTQQIILVTLYNHGSLSMSGLARSVRTSNEQATRAIAQLVKMGFVERVQNEVNRRIINIYLTPAAESYIKQVFDSAAEILKETDAGKTSKSFKEIKELSNKLNNIVDADVDKEKQKL